MSEDSTLAVGRLIDGSGLATLDARRFNRHTFWCGQSGSGKTYALGVVLEQLFLRTRLPLLIFDPNADFVNFGQVREDVDGDTARAWGQREVTVLHSTDTSRGSALHVRYADLDLTSQAAVLRLDPVRDAEAYNALLHFVTQVGRPDMERDRMLELMRRSPDPGWKGLSTRIENLGVLDWDLWARGRESAEDVVSERRPATVLDLGGFRNRDEPKAAALAILDHLWLHREERRPLLIVIDEAHNLCPPDPVTRLEVALTERLIQIAAEGRKFGLWLLLSTQRPTKIHPNVLSQCDNLALLKMSTPRDLAELETMFGYAPIELIEQSPGFRQGEVLLAGGFIGSPSIVQIGRRITVEGGTDVRVPLA